MAEDTKPVQGKPKVKMIPESDIIAFKKGSTEREKRLREELAESKQRAVEAEAGLKIAKTDTEDEEAVNEIKKYLLKREATLNEKNETLDKRDKDLASKEEEREKEDRVKMLASEYQVEAKDIKDADDQEKEALRLVTKRLTEEKEQKEAPTPGSVFESNTPGSVKKNVKDMNDPEFDKAWEEKNQEALSKK